MAKACLARYFITAWGAPGGRGCNWFLWLPAPSRATEAEDGGAQGHPCPPRPLQPPISPTPAEGAGAGWHTEGDRPRIGSGWRPGPIRGQKEGPRPVSRTPRCSEVSSQLVVKATGC